MYINNFQRINKVRKLKIDMRTSIDYVRLFGRGGGTENFTNPHLGRGWGQKNFLRKFPLSKHIVHNILTTLSND